MRLAFLESFFIKTNVSLCNVKSTISYQGSKPYLLKLSVLYNCMVGSFLKSVMYIDSITSGAETQGRIFGRRHGWHDPQTGV